MADSKISALTLDTLAASDDIPIRRAGANFKVQPTATGASLFNAASKVAARGSIDADVLTITAISATATLTAAALEGLYNFTTGSGAIQTLTLPAAASCTGRSILFRKVDSGTTRGVISDGTDRVWLRVIGDNAVLTSDGTSWIVADWHKSSVRTPWNASGTFDVDPLLSAIDVAGCGGGGGGGGGCRRPSSSIRTGGSGGSGAAYAQKRIPRSALGVATSVAVTIGAGGTSGAGATADTTTGIAGGSGGKSLFGAFFQVEGGGSGAGGQSSTSFSSRGGVGIANGVTGSAGTHSTATATPGTIGYAGGGGGGGGGHDAANARRNGGNAGNSISDESDLVGGVGGGATDGAAGAAGASSATNSPCAGSGGGGGAAGVAVAAGNGGDGGNGGGGGGGGAGDNGFNGGNGGAGGNGKLVIHEIF